MGDKSPTKTIKEIMLADGDGFPPQEIQLQQLNPEDRDDTYSTKGDLAREVTEDDVAADIIVKAGAWDGELDGFIYAQEPESLVQRSTKISDFGRQQNTDMDASSEAANLRSGFYNLLVKTNEGCPKGLFVFIF